MASCQVVVALTRASYCSYKDVLKRNLKAYDIPANSLESLAQDRYLWRTTSRGAAAASEASRTDHLRQVRDRRKARAVQQRVDGLYSADLADACVVQELRRSPTRAVTGRRADTNDIRRSRRVTPSSVLVGSVVCI